MHLARQLVPGRSFSTTPSAPVKIGVNTSPVASSSREEQQSRSLTLASVLRGQDFSYSVILLSRKGRVRFVAKRKEGYNLQIFATTLYSFSGGQGLQFKQLEIQETVINTGVKLGRRSIKEPDLRQIVSDSKKVFAEGVVPKLSDQAFKNFEDRFSLIQDVMTSLLKKKKIQRSNTNALNGVTLSLRATKGSVAISQALSA